MEPNEKDKKEYELGYMAKDESAPADILGAVRAAGGEVTLEGPVNRVRLAYEIKKENEAFFGFVQFAMKPDAVKGLSDALSLKPDVLRFLLVTPPPMKDRRRSGDDAKPASAAPQDRAVRSEVKAAGPLSNEDLEKTIEEILQ